MRGVDHGPACLEEELVGPRIVGPFGQTGCGEGLIEFAMQAEAPGIDFGPGLFAAFDGEEGGAVFIQAHAEFAFTECADARDQEAHEVHGMFPFDLTAGAKVLLQLLELAHDIAVVGLVDEPGEEHAAMVEEFPGEWGCVFHQRCVEAFEDVGVGLQRHDQELLEFPIGFLGGVFLDLTRDAIKRPMEVGRRQVNAAAIHIRMVVAQSEGLGPNDTAVDDERCPLAELGFVRGRIHGAGFLGLELLQDGEGGAAKHGFGAVVEADPIGVVGVGG